MQLYHFDFSLPSHRGSILKEKNLLPLQQILSFKKRVLLKEHHFPEKETGSTKVVPLGEKKVRRDGGVPCDTVMPPCNGLNGTLFLE